MGVDSLLPFVSTAMSDAHISDFRGETLAVDASCWLHRGAHACTTELALGQPTGRRHLGFALKMVRLLRSHGVTPLLIFDGGPAPMKADTNAARRESRARHLARGKALHAEGSLAKAAAEFDKAVSVTPLMARQLIAALRELGVGYIVAPYEADPQLAFLVSRGFAAAAISEDSDLIPYRCPHVLYKLDVGGHAKLLSYENLRFVEAADGRQRFEGAWPDEWRAWQSQLLVDACILAGTDYLPGVAGIGLKKAHALLRRHRSLEACLPHLPPLPGGERSRDETSALLESFLAGVNLARQARDRGRFLAGHRSTCARGCARGRLCVIVQLCVAGIPLPAGLGPGVGGGRPVQRDGRRASAGD
jgi:exonuclease-1